MVENIDYECRKYTKDGKKEMQMVRLMNWVKLRENKIGEMREWLGIEPQWE